MHSTGSRKRSLVTVALVITTSACADSSAPVEPTLDERTPTTVAGDVILGGEEALRAAEARIERFETEGRGDDIPIDLKDFVRDARPAAAPPLRPSFLITEDGASVTGPYVIGGVTYYESGGELWPPEGRQAYIIQSKTTGTLEPFKATVFAGFQFEGHQGAQQTRWAVSNPVTGQTIRQWGPAEFGSRRDLPMGFLAKFVMGDFTINNLPACDISLSASSAHQAWYWGWWDFLPEGTAGTNGVIGIKLGRERLGLAYAGSALLPEPAIYCPKPPDDCAVDNGDDGDDEEEGETGDMLRSPGGAASLSCSGGGGGGFEDEVTCTICQQWFWVENGIIVDEWWECWDSSTDPLCMTVMT